MKDYHENSDGVGVTGKLLASFPSVEVDLGTGMLAQMGVKQRLALRQPLVSSSQHSQGDARLLMTLIARQHKPITALRPDYSFQPAVTVDMHDDRLGETFHASAIDERRAREHGYATAVDMRKSLRLHKNEDPLLFSYAIRTADPVDMVTEDSDKAGTYLNARRDAAYRVWSELQNERTIRWASDYLDTLPEEDKFRALARITPREKLNGLAAYAPEESLALNQAGTRPLPQEVAILRGLPTEALPEQKPATKVCKPVRSPSKGKLTEGDGWTLVNPPQKAKPSASPSLDAPAKPVAQPGAIISPKPNGEERAKRVHRRAAIRHDASSSVLDSLSEVHDKLDGRMRTQIVTDFADDRKHLKRIRRGIENGASQAGGDDSLKSRGGRS